jgi:hypothetical protein
VLSVLLQKTTAAIKKGKSSETGNIRYTRHRTKTNKIEKDKTIEKTKMMSNSDPNKYWG